MMHTSGIPTLVPMTDDARVEQLHGVIVKSTKALNEIARAVNDVGLVGQASLIDSIVSNMKQVLINTTDKTNPIDIT